MSEAGEIAVKLAVLRALKYHIREIETELGVDLLSELDDGDAKAATLDDGTRLGKFTRTRGKRMPTVVNERQFVDWVRKHYPTEITEAVREPFRSNLLDSAKEYGVAVDKKTGEVIPGVELRTGNPSISWRGEHGWEQVVFARWQELARTVLELPGGEL